MLQYFPSIFPCLWLLWKGIWHCFVVSNVRYVSLLLLSAYIEVLSCDDLSHPFENQFVNMLIFFGSSSLVFDLSSSVELAINCMLTSHIERNPIGNDKKGNAGLNRLCYITFCRNTFDCSYYWYLHHIAVVRLNLDENPYDVIKVEPEEKYIIRNFHLKRKKRPRSSPSLIRTIAESFLRYILKEIYEMINCWCKCLIGKFDAWKCKKKNISKHN